LLNYFFLYAFSKPPRRAALALYNDFIKLGIKIDFEEDKTTSCWGVQQLLHFKITSNDSIANPEGMAHELLHIELSIKGFKSGLTIASYFNSSNSLFDLEFIQILNNDLAHFKMIDRLLELGYNVDNFLQDTPKKYFLDSIYLRVLSLVMKHKTGFGNVCEEAKEIILSTGSAKLFEMYKLKDPNTVNGVHSSLILEPLQEINKELVSRVEMLFTNWNETPSVDNYVFFHQLHELLQEFKIPNAIACPA
jgi:hypothetical protein